MVFPISESYQNVNVNVISLPENSFTQIKLKSFSILINNDDDLESKQIRYVVQFHGHSNLSIATKK